MCMIDDAVMPAFSHSSVNAARAPYTCCECGRRISKGERYERCYGKWEDRFDTFRTCSHCLLAREWLERECNGFCYAGVLEDLEPHFEGMLPCPERVEVAPYRGDAPQVAALRRVRAYGPEGGRMSEDRLRDAIDNVRRTFFSDKGTDDPMPFEVVSGEIIASLRIVLFAANKLHSMGARIREPEKVPE